MTAVAVPGARSRRAGEKWLRKLRALPARAAALLKPARPALANLASIPLHVAGLACFDMGVFTACTAAGWMVTGLSLIWLEHVIADEQ